MKGMLVAWMECKPAGRSFSLKFNTRKEGRDFASRVGADIVEWRRGN